MISPRAGTLLVASPVIGDPNFDRSVVLILRHGDDGTVGVVIDRPTTIDVGEYLPEWESVAAPPAVVFAGGPVEPEVGIALAVGVGGSVDVVDLEAGPVDERPVRVFAGYAGWSPGQLDAEVSQGGWFVVAADPSDPVTPDPDDLWPTILRRQRSRLSLFATHPYDPTVN